MGTTEPLVSYPSLVLSALYRWFNETVKTPLYIRVETLQPIFECTKIESSFVDHPYLEFSMKLTLDIEADYSLPDCGELVKILLLIKSSERNMFAWSEDITYIFKKT